MSVKPGDVVRYHGHGNFGPYYCNLKEGDILVVTDAFTHHTGKELIVAFNKQLRGGIITQESTSPTVIKRESLRWGPKFLVGDYVYVKEHENDDYNTEQLYGRPCRVVDVYVYEDEGVFRYDIDEDLDVSVMERYLISAAEYDPDIVPNNIDEILV